jgi:hypothetical protein
MIVKRVNKMLKLREDMRNGLKEILISKPLTSSLKSKIKRHSGTIHTGKRLTSKLKRA